MNNALALLLTLTSLGQTDALFEKFFDTFAENRDAIKSFQAQFTQDTITPDEVITSTGTIIYTNPKRLVFRYDDPELIYIIAGQRFYDYDPELEQLQIFKIEDRPEAEAFFLGLSDDTDRLQEAYTIKILPPIDPERGGVGLLLLPQPREGEEPLFERIVLQLDPEHFLPSQIHIVSDEESEVLYALDEFVINGPLDIEKTHMLLPEGTDIIADDEFIETVGPGGKRMPEADTTETALPEPVQEFSDQ
jgi:outer membrane lipoprotein-sorting protein